ncbi:MAG: hypothetical protein K6U02_07190 [Firmicutes bacterium]|nr:hypothetical protein [Bacillota bacterium]
MTSALRTLLLLGFAFSSTPVLAAMLPGPEASFHLPDGESPTSVAPRPYLRLPHSLPVGALSGIEIPAAPVDLHSESRGALAQPVAFRFPRWPAIAIANPAGLQKPTVPETVADRDGDFRVMERAREDAGRKQWWTLAIAQHAAAAFDAWTTRRVVANGWGQETNPLLQPFARSDALYVAIHVGPAIQDYLGKRMRTSSHPVLQRFWWLPQLAGTVLHLWSGIHNLGVARRAQAPGL